MTRKQLEELGYSEEQVNQLMDLNGKAINSIKVERDEALAKLTSTQEELTKRENDFKELQENASEEMKTKFEELNTEYNDYKAQAEKREQEIKLNSALGIAIAKSGTIDEVSLKANLDMSSIELTEKGLQGFDEQIVTLKENKKFLFGENLNGGLKHQRPVEKEVSLRDTLFGKQ